MQALHALLPAADLRALSDQRLQTNRSRRSTISRCNDGIVCEKTLQVVGAQPPHSVARFRSTESKFGRIVNDQHVILGSTAFDGSQRVCTEKSFGADLWICQVDAVVPDHLWAELDVKPARVLIDNLVGNAWKFTGKTSVARLEVGGSDVGGAYAFFVRDNGAGFDMAFADKLFAPFQRLHRVGEFPGTGIGLATVQRVVHRHGGRIWAEGSVGSGATFYFTLGSQGEPI